jgi:TnpA family transposase
MVLEGCSQEIGNGYSTIIRKLSSYKRYSKTKLALWAYDSIFESLHILNFINDKNIRSYIRKVLNRIEAYHRLRKAILKIHSGKLKGETILENEIWNQCSRLIANCIIYYNSVLLDEAFKRLEYGTINNLNISNIKSISPIWRATESGVYFEFDEFSD